eukprot:g1867.t1
MSFPKLSGSAIDLNLLREMGKKELHSLLSSHSGDKCCVLDPRLTRPLNLVTEGVQVFKSNEVKEFKELGWEKLSTECPTVIYIVRPDMLMMKQIATQIREDPEKDSRRYALYFVPRRTFICAQILKEEGVFHDVQLGEFHVDLIPFENDVLSMELHTAFKECFLLNDTTSLFYVARSLMKLQSLFGVIPHLKAKGAYASRVVEMMLRFRQEQVTASGSEQQSRPSEIDMCIIIDRQVDLLTPLVMPLTYEGLIDELFGIENGIVYIEPGVLDDDTKAPSTSNSSSSKKQSYLRLNNNSSLYAEARNSNISALGPLLQEKSREIRAMYNARPDAGNSVQDLKAFVKQIPALKESFAALTAHTHLAEKIFKVTNSRAFRQQWQVERVMMEGGSGLEFIEEAIAEQRPLTSVLRLLCLHSLTQGGLRQKEFNFLRTEVLQTYGFEVLLTLNNLDRLGLFCKRGSPNISIATNWNVIRNKLKLIFNDVKCNGEPDDIAYVTSGYAPLLVRLVQLAISGHWKRNESTLKLLPGPQVEVMQETQGRILSASNESNMSGKVLRERNENGNQSGATQGEGEKKARRRKVVLVFVVGGCTLMETSALRYLAKPRGNKESQFDIIIATTKLVSGKTFMKSCIESVQTSK